MNHLKISQKCLHLGKKFKLKFYKFKIYPCDAFKYLSKNIFVYK